MRLAQEKTQGNGKRRSTRALSSSQPSHVVARVERSSRFFVLVPRPMVLESDSVITWLFPPRGMLLSSFFLTFTQCLWSLQIVSYRYSLLILYYILSFRTSSFGYNTKLWIWLQLNLHHLPVTASSCESLNLNYYRWDHWDARVWVVILCLCWNLFLVGCILIV